MFRALRSLAFYAVFYGGTAGFALAVLLTAAINRDAMFAVINVWSGFHRFCASALLGIRLRIEGEIPQGGVLVAIRHESFYEAIDLPHMFDQPVVFAKAELLDLPLWGRAARRYGIIGIEREQGARALRTMMKRARERMNEGRVLVIFPEGTRIRHGVRAPLQAGFAGLYKLLGLPVVPVAVDSGPAYHRIWKRPGTITVRFGAAIPPGLPRDDIEARVLTAINALNPVETADQP